MMLTFSIAAIRAVIARGISDAEANGGFRDPHFGLVPDMNEKPGLWLVGDQGVYAMSNGKLAEGAQPLVVYAEGCDLNKDDDWFDVKRRTFGGDDGVDFLDAEGLEALIAASPGCTHLQIAFLPDAMQLSVIARD